MRSAPSFAMDDVAMFEKMSNSDSFAGNNFAGTNSSSPKNASCSAPQALTFSAFVRWITGTMQDTPEPSPRTTIRAEGFPSRAMEPLPFQKMAEEASPRNRRFDEQETSPRNAFKPFQTIDEENSTAYETNTAYDSTNGCNEWDGALVSDVPEMSYEEFWQSIKHHPLRDAAIPPSASPMSRSRSPRNSTQQLSFFATP